MSNKKKRRDTSNSTRSFEPSPSNSSTQVEYATRPHLKTTPALAKFNWQDVLFQVILVFVAWGLCKYVLDLKMMLVGDDTDYFALGKALHQGDGYVSILSPDKPEYNHFPPGYPFFLSLVMYVSSHIATLKAANGVLLVMASLLLFRLFKSMTHNSILSFVACLFVVINPNALQYSFQLMSEMLFMTLSIAAIYAFIKMDPKKAFYLDTWFYITVGLLAMGYYTRTVAVALAAGMVLSLLFQKQWLRIVGLVAGTWLLVLPWQVRTARLGGSSHFNQMLMKNPLRPELGLMDGTIGAWFERVLINSKRYFAIEVPTMLQSVLPNVPLEGLPLSYWIPGSVFTVLMLWGLFRLKAHSLFLVGYIGATLAILLIYPEVWVGSRLIFHLLPFFVLLIAYGLYDLAMVFLKRVGEPVSIVGQWAIPLLLSLALFSYRPAIKNLHEIAVNGTYNKEFSRFIQAAEWVRDNTPPDAVISCRKPSIFYFFSGRYSNYYANTTDKQELLDDLKRKKVTHVVFDGLGYSSTGLYLMPAINSEPEKFKQVYFLEDPNTYVFSFKPDNGYVGEYKDGVRHGKGTYVWDNGLRYEGEWRNNVRHGKGTLNLADGGRYEGDWKNDKEEGQGTFHLADGRKYVGTFVDNKFEGIGTLYDAKGGILFQGRWRNGTAQINQ